MKTATILAGALLAAGATETVNFDKADVGKAPSGRAEGREQLRNRQALRTDCLRRRAGRKRTCSGRTSPSERSY